MKITYEPATDILRIVLSEAQVDQSDEVSPGVILDCDEDANPVGMQILDASKCIANPRSVEFTVAG